MLTQLAYYLTRADEKLRTPLVRGGYFALACLQTLYKLYSTHPDPITFAILTSVAIFMSIAAYWSTYAILDPSLDWLMQTPLVTAGIQAVALLLVNLAQATLTMLAVLGHFAADIFLLITPALSIFLALAGTLAIPLFAIHGIPLIAPLALNHHFATHTPAFVKSISRVQFARQTKPYLPSHKHGAYLLHATTQILLVRH